MNVLELTQELVRINSENPPGNEKAIASYIKDFLESAGISAELIEFEKNRCNVIAELGEGEGLMLNGHIDTVPFGKKENWKFNPTCEIAGEKFYGRGASDMKAGVAAMLLAAKEFAKEKFKRRLVLAFVADEETLQKGSDWLIKNKKEFFKGIKLGVVGECSENNIRLSQRGLFDSRVKFFGKAAHGARPWQGESAILKAAKFSLALEELGKKLAKKKHPLLGIGSINVGTIKGGAKVNIVPDYCEMEITRRLSFGETEKSALADYKNILEKLKLKADIEIMMMRLPHFVKPNAQIVKLLQKAGAGKAVDGANYGYTEAELYSTELGIQTVVCGPGSIETARAADEFVKIKEIEKPFNVYKNLIKNLCC